MSLLKYIHLVDVKNFLICVGYNIEGYALDLEYDEEKEKLNLLLIKDGVYSSMEFYETIVIVDEIEDDELSFDWCSYLHYLFGIIYKKTYLKNSKELYKKSDKVVYLPNGLPEGTSIEEVIDKYYETFIEEELDDLIDILNEENYKWVRLNRIGLVRKKIKSNVNKDKA